MERVKWLLQQGNHKLGRNIFQWSVPPVVCCPGATACCKAVCYATKGRFLLPFVKKKLEENYRVALTDDFADRMIREVKRRWVQVCRVHVSGDYFSREYAEKWLSIFRACQKAKFYWYSRSWVIPEIEPVLREMALLRNVRAWWSADRDSGVPEKVPPGTRVAWLQDRSEDDVENIDLLFTVRKVRRERLSLPVLCPHEAGKAEDCGECSKCWR